MKVRRATAHGIAAREGVQSCHWQGRLQRGMRAERRPSGLPLRAATPPAVLRASAVSLPQCRLPYPSPVAASRYCHLRPPLTRCFFSSRVSWRQNQISFTFSRLSSSTRRQMPGQAGARCASHGAAGRRR